MASEWLLHLSFDIDCLFPLFATHSKYGSMAYFVLISLYVRSLFLPGGCFLTCISVEDEVGSASFSLKTMLLHFRIVLNKLVRQILKKP